MSLLHAVTGPEASKGYVDSQNKEEAWIGIA